MSTFVKLLVCVFADPDWVLSEIVQKVSDSNTVTSFSETNNFFKKLGFYVFLGDFNTENVKKNWSHSQKFTDSFLKSTQFHNSTTELSEFSDFCCQHFFTFTLNSLFLCHRKFQLLVPIRQSASISIKQHFVASLCTFHSLHRIVSTWKVCIIQIKMIQKFKDSTCGIFFTIVLIFIGAFGFLFWWFSIAQFQDPNEVSTKNQEVIYKFQENNLPFLLTL